MGCGVSLRLTLRPPTPLLLLLGNMAPLVGELPAVEDGVMRLSYCDHSRPGGAGVGSNVGESPNGRLLEEESAGETASAPYTKPLVLAMLALAMLLLLLLLLVV